MNEETPNNETSKKIRGIKYYCKNGEVVYVEDCKDGYILIHWNGKTRRRPITHIGTEIFSVDPTRKIDKPKRNKPVFKSVEVTLPKSKTMYPSMPEQFLSKPGISTNSKNKSRRKTKTNHQGGSYPDKSRRWDENNTDYFSPSRPRERKKKDNQITHYNYKGLNQFGYDQDGYDPNCGHPKYWKDDNFDEQL